MKHKTNMLKKNMLKKKNDGKKTFIFRNKEHRLFQEALLKLDPWSVNDLFVPVGN